MKNLTEQIQEELDQRAVRRSNITDIDIVQGLVMFKADGTTFWGKLTKTGKLKKHSVRIDTF